LTNKHRPLSIQCIGVECKLVV